MRREIDEGETELEPQSSLDFYATERAGHFSHNMEGRVK